MECATKVVSSSIRKRLKNVITCGQGLEKVVGKFLHEIEILGDFRAKYRLIIGLS